MRDPHRITEVLEEIEQLWRLHPDWRLGQLISNLTAWSDPIEGSVYDIEDETLVEEAHRHLSHLTVSVGSE